MEHLIVILLDGLALVLQLCLIRVVLLELLVTQVLVLGQVEQFIRIWVVTL